MFPCLFLRPPPQIMLVCIKFAFKTDKLFFSPNRILSLMWPHTQGLKEVPCYFFGLSVNTLGHKWDHTMFRWYRTVAFFSINAAASALFTGMSRKVCNPNGHSFISLQSPLFCFWVGRWPPFTTSQSRESRLRSHMRTRGRVICWYPAW